MGRDEETGPERLPAVPELLKRAGCRSAFTRKSLHQKRTIHVIQNLDNLKSYRHAENSDYARLIRRPEFWSAIIVLDADSVVYSPQTAISLPAGSTKWNRLPPGNEKIGLTTVPPAFSTASRVSSRFSE